MSYFEIEKQLVYMPHEKYSQILIEELKVTDYRGYYIATSSEKKPEDQIRHEAIVYDFLKCIYNSDHESFIREWVNFELSDEAVTNNIWDLLYDYCYYYGHALLKDARSDYKQIMDDLSGDTSYYLPMGNTFALVMKNKCSKFALKTAFKNAPETRILIKANSVTKIVGKLIRFDIYFDNGSIISCFNDIAVKPF